MLQLEDLLKLTEPKQIGYFYLPIEDRDTHKNWIRDIVTGEGTEAEKIQTIKNSPILKKGKIMQYTMPHLNLPVVVYVDDQGNKVESWRECQLYLARSGNSRFPINIDEIEEQDIVSLARIFSYTNLEDGFHAPDLRPDIKKVDVFDVSGISANGFRASQTFTLRSGTVELKYSAGIDDSLNITHFSIEMDVIKDNAHAMRATIDVKDVDGTYTPKAEILLSNPEKRGDDPSMVFYNFGVEGFFDYIKLGSTVYGKAECNNDKTYFDALTLPDHEKTGLRIPTGILYSISHFQKYFQLCKHFQEHPLMNMDPEKPQLDYVDAIIRFANARSSDDLPMIGGRPQLGGE